jgi:hypothetical protein
MDELCAPPTRATGKVPAFDKGNTKATRRSIQRDASASNATAND